MNAGVDVAARVGESVGSAVYVGGISVGALCRASAVIVSCAASKGSSVGSAVALPGRLHACRIKMVMAIR